MPCPRYYFYGHCPRGEVYGVSVVIIGYGLQTERFGYKKTPGSKYLLVLCSLHPKQLTVSRSF